MHTFSDHPQYALAGLLGWVVLYLIYKLAWRRDFGMPIRRSVTSRKLTVDRNQVAYVPIWWSDIQVQRAIDRYWKQTLQKGFDRRLLNSTGGSLPAERP